MKSLSEIDTTVKRATKAMGFSWGIAEEIGKNIRLLELFGLPGLKNLNQYFKDCKTKQFQKISLISKLNESLKIPYCPIIFGTNFIDQSKILENLVEFKVKPVPSVCVRVVSWSAPKYITELSARYKSDHSNDAVPRASPSADAGSALLNPVAVPLFAIVAPESIVKVVPDNTLIALAPMR